MATEIEMSKDSMIRILAMAKAAGPTIKRNVYSRIRAAAEPTAQAAREKVLGELPPPANQANSIAKLFGHTKFGNNHKHTGLRRGIAAGVSIGINSSGKSAGVRISSSAAFLNESQRAHSMNRVYNLETFKHPIFGKKKAAQHGLRWFYGPIDERRDSFRSAVEKAMQETADELGKL